MGGEDMCRRYLIRESRSQEKRANAPRFTAASNLSVHTQKYIILSYREKRINLNKKKKDKKNENAKIMR